MPGFEEFSVKAQEMSTQLNEMSEGVRTMASTFVDALKAVQRLREIDEVLDELA